MKTLITLSLALLTISSQAKTNLAKGIVVDVNIAAAVQASHFEQGLVKQFTNEPGKFAPVTDTTILNPVSVVGMSDKSLEEVIAEDKKITESNIADEGYLFFQEITDEQLIAIGNQIIDSSIEQVRPLYLEPTIEDTIEENNAIIEAVMPDVWNKGKALTDF